MSLRQKGPWPSLSHLVLTTVRSCTDRKGASFPFIKNMLATKGYNVVRNGSHLKVAVGALLSKGLLQQVTGSGLTGSFRLGHAGEERAEGTGRRGRAVGEARRRPAGTTKGPRRAVKATARRLKTRRPRGKAAAAGGVEEVGDPAPAEGERRPERQDQPGGEDAPGPTRTMETLVKVHYWADLVHLLKGKCLFDTECLLLWRCAVVVELLKVIIVYQTKIGNA
ncbi:histone H1.4-like [Accipiter gentilis]|uniref:histone H1.4-like n=1 Tax=Astur gentilis TaxID=8957 RepID=UPI00210FC9DA|nr:histone H1.4-like [Accipiter gentilis]